MPVDLPKGAFKTAEKLGLTSLAQEDFFHAIKRGQSGRTALAIASKAPSGYILPFSCVSNPPDWVCEGVFILNDDQNEIKPGSHPDYQQGLYYPLDLSSVWETAGLSEIPTPSRCLDLCASPGGKSILAQKRLSPRIHIANEVDGKRLGILRSNLSRTGFQALYTHRLRPEQWAEICPSAFDLVLVDAPCSGQSLLAKGIDNPWCFTTNTIKGNAKRQRGILHKAIDCLAPGGYLLYTTCTFAPEENEKNIGYILKRYPDIKAVPVSSLEAFQSPIADFSCYRLLPINGFGSGGFSCLLQKGGSPSELPSLPDDVLNWPVKQMNSTS